MAPEHKSGVKMMLRHRTAGVSWKAGVVLLCSVAAASLGQSAGASDLQAVLERLRDRGGIPAMGAAIFTGDKIEWIGAAGVRAIGHDEKATVDDLWHLGSCTKSMTGTLIAEMCEKGELSPTMTIAEGLPGLGEGIEAKYRVATLSQLLTMTAGVPAELSKDSLWSRLWKQNGTVVEQRAELSQAVLSWGPKQAPGSKFEYANASFAIAGHIAEVKSGKPWEELMQERVFGPLGIKSAGFGAPGTAGRVDQPWGHRVKEKGSRELVAVDPGSPGADNPPAISPAGRVHMSMSDWAKYLMLHVRRGEGQPSIMKRVSFDLMQTPPEGKDYAWGWGTASRPWGGRVLTHSGSNTMWFCVAWVSPEKGFGVLVVTNVSMPDTPKVCDEVCWNLIQKRLASSAKEEPKK